MDGLPPGLGGSSADLPQDLLAKRSAANSTNCSRTSARTANNLAELRELLYARSTLGAAATSRLSCMGSMII
eukprot:5850951-Amphidinium_carterae.1